MPRARLTAKEMHEQAIVLRWMRDNMTEVAESILRCVSDDNSDGIYERARDNRDLPETIAELLNEESPTREPDDSYADIQADFQRAVGRV